MCTPPCRYHRFQLARSAAFRGECPGSMGASLLDIGTILGHRSQQTTKRYAHLTESRLRDLVEQAAQKHRVA